jgi:hypothetical protein
MILQKLDYHEFGGKPDYWMLKDWPKKTIMPKYQVNCLLKQ